MGDVQHGHGHFAPIVEKHLFCWPPHVRQLSLQDTRTFKCCITSSEANEILQLASFLHQAPVQVTRLRAPPCISFFETLARQHSSKYEKGIVTHRVTRRLAQNWF